MDMNIKGKRAVVCGSTQGIGHAAAIELALLGAKVTLLARDEAKLRELATVLPGEEEHDFLVADFSDVANVEHALQRFTGAGRTAEILVNNSGGPPAGELLDASFDAFRQAFNNHLLCNQALVQALLPGMRTAGYGRIVNVISTSVKQPIAGLGVSNTIRGAVANWAKTLAAEVAADGITVNNVLPGFTSTGRLASLITTKAQKGNTTEKAIIEQMQSSIPAGRFGDAHEVAAAIAFLCTPAAAYINGINVPVDGGRTSCL